MKTVIKIPLAIVTFSILLAGCAKEKNQKPTTASTTSSYGLTTTFAPFYYTTVINTNLQEGTFTGFERPSALKIDQDGNLYLLEKGISHVQKILPGGGETIILAGNYAGFPGYSNGADTAAQFFNPAGIAVTPVGVLYVADTYNNCIRQVTTAGMVSTVAGNQGLGGSFENGLATQAIFNLPGGVAIDAAGNIYVSDTGNNVIRKITPDGMVTLLAGSGRKGDADGQGGAASFNSPLDLIADPSGNLYVADSGNDKIRKITPSGLVSTYAGNGTAGADNGKAVSASFNIPASIAFDASGNLFVADEGNNLIRKITKAGVVSTLAGGAAGLANGTGTAASFNQPHGIAVDKDDNVYVADMGNGLIRKIVAKE
jgi:sugar lactone lactonase YvrE